MKAHHASPPVILAYLDRDAPFHMSAIMLGSYGCSGFQNSILISAFQNHLNDCIGINGCIEFFRQLLSAKHSLKNIEAVSVSDSDVSVMMMLYELILVHAYLV
ncbi:hypothetical protein AVEN_240541-1 [Araneus ventricosus]|uniref:Uncharacterized protein n=1 Tax=Araneus ventricosus TaxID=182803 RepID=A0A4Y2WJC0_ARAVE|nr:hypothetical protein AVEN_240541-1 [Araneus ventricosus]